MSIEITRRAMHRHRRHVVEGDLQLKPRFSPTYNWGPFGTPTSSASSTPTPSEPSDPLTNLFPVPPLEPATTESSTSSAVSSSVPVVHSSSSSSTSTSSTSSVVTTSSSSTTSSSVSSSSPTSIVSLPSTASSSVTTETIGSRVSTVITYSTAAPPPFNPGNANANLAPSASPSAAASTSMSAGELIGGIVAAVVAVIVVVAAGIYFLRKNKRNEDEEPFNPNAFRAQSIALPDDAPSPMARGPSFNGGRSGPRPPTMIERKYNNALSRPPMLQSQAPYSDPYSQYGQSNQYSDYNQPQPAFSFQPGQIIFSPHSNTPQDTTFSPIGQSPIVPPAPVAEGDLVRRTSNGSASSLSRKNSAMAAVVNPFDSPDDAHYVDLSRSSVTPFQAAQYVEISRKLNVAPPQPLVEITEDNEDAKTVREAEEPTSPFADPEAEITAPTPRISMPPRIASIPPVLPEIRMQARPFSPMTVNSDNLNYPLPVSVRGSPAASPFGATFNLDSPKISDFVLPPSAAPSKLQFSVTAPAPPLSPIAGSPQEETVEEKKRPETIYNDEDAYAGI